MANGIVRAAGGIVVHDDGDPRIAVVQLAKYGNWVLPKGKLAKGENARTAARREVVEETGHEVTVHEFLGTLAYEVARGPKVVEFWRMRAVTGQIHELMRDIRAVDWLPLDAAIARLTHPREQAFLASVGPVALAAARGERVAVPTARDGRERLTVRTCRWLRRLFGRPSAHG